MKLAIIFPTLNQHDLAKTSIDFAVNLLADPADVVVLDNGSNPPFEYADLLQNSEKNYVQIVNLSKNIGVYPTFWEALKYTDADILAFFHTDLMIAEQGWDARVIKTFESIPKLGLIGFVGSNEIDSSGGRGVGTTSNFQDRAHVRRLADGTEKIWKGSPAEAHGMRNEGFTFAAGVDGCAMIFRREVLEQIKQRPDFPVHHFYDRLLSCETRELGYDVGVLGIGCDHISGQTANTEADYGKEWALAHGLTKAENENWDQVIYKEAERQWLSEYRDTKHFIPCKV